MAIRCTRVERCWSASGQSRLAAATDTTCCAIWASSGPRSAKISANASGTSPRTAARGAQGPTSRTDRWWGGRVEDAERREQREPGHRLGAERGEVGREHPAERRADHRARQRAGGVERVPQHGEPAEVVGRRLEPGCAVEARRDRAPRHPTSSCASAGDTPGSPAMPGQVDHAHAAGHHRSSYSDHSVRSPGITFSAKRSVLYRTRSGRMLPKWSSSIM